MVAYIKNKLIKFGFYSLLGIVCFSATLFIPTFTQATTIEFTTTSDWSSGTATQIETTSELDAIQLQANGIWGARSWKTPDQPFSIGAAFTTDGTDIYAVRGVGDVLFWKYSPTTDTWTTLANLPYGAYYGT